MEWTSEACSAMLIRSLVVVVVVVGGGGGGGGDRAVIIVVAVVVIFVFMGVVNRDDFDDICVDCWLFVYVS